MKAERRPPWQVREKVASCLIGLRNYNLDWLSVHGFPIVQAMVHFRWILWGENYVLRNWKIEFLKNSFLIRWKERWTSCFRSRIESIINTINLKNFTYDIKWAIKLWTLQDHFSGRFISELSFNLSLNTNEIENRFKDTLIEEIYSCKQNFKACANY